jgi:branched-chain amino acid transport system ATP-binding protein
MLLTVENLVAKYGQAVALQGVSLEIDEGRIVVVIGANGSGKSTLLKNIISLITPAEGKITFDGRDITGIGTHNVVRTGIALVPEGKRIFAKMTVRENLLLGALIKKDPVYRVERMETIYELFPRLKERENQMAGTLSGGEQQMLAIGRALMPDPRLLMLDEPSLGIAPKLVEKIFEAIQVIRDAGVTIVLVEQHVQESLEIADYSYVLQTGKIFMQGTGPELLKDQTICRAYLGM